MATLKERIIALEAQLIALEKKQGIPADLEEQINAVIDARVELETSKEKVKLISLDPPTPQAVATFTAPTVETVVHESEPTETK